MSHYRTWALTCANVQAWVFAHIQLTPQEAAEYKNAPVVYDGEYGFFFEPNESVNTHISSPIGGPLLT